MHAAAALITGSHPRYIDSHRILTPLTSHPSHSPSIPSLSPPNRSPLTHPLSQAAHPLITASLSHHKLTYGDLSMGRYELLPGHHHTTPLLTKTASFPLFSFFFLLTQDYFSPPSLTTSLPNSQHAAPGIPPSRTHPPLPQSRRKRRILRLPPPNAAFPGLAGLGVGNSHL